MVAIIILTVNALEMTKEQLQGVSKINTKGLECECVLVDNGSTDGSYEFLRNFKLPNMASRYIFNDSNLGYAAGNNVGIKYALNKGFEYVILMNNDLILEDEVVLKLVGFLEENKDVGMASPKMYFAKGYEFHKDRYKEKDLGKVIWYAGGIIDWNNVYSSHRGVDEIDVGQYEEVIDTDIANGACVIIRREVFQKIGFLDESLFLYWEDADFSQRAKKNGFRVCYFPKTHIWHKVSVSAGGSGNISNDYFLTRNRYFFAIKYAKLRTKIAVLKDTLKLIFSGRKWQRWGALDALLNRKGMGQWRYR